jgi:purine-nucleoside phosphorylase
MRHLNGETSAFLKEHFPSPVEAALILGSGLNPLAENFGLEFSLPYSEIPHFPSPSTQGHTGKLHVGVIRGLALAVFEGRLHYYEGLSLDHVVFPVRAAHALGAKRLIVTNAAGGIHPALDLGSFMLLRDHLNLMGGNPLRGMQEMEAINPFPDMTHAYSRKLRAHAREVFQRLGTRCFEGVLAAVTGPSYETPAEIRMLQSLGADAVCMSTVPEVIMARALNMDVLGISLITNKAAGITEEILSHKDIVRTGNEGSGDFFNLLLGVIDFLKNETNREG